MKTCFVTTGATAPFTALIESVLSPLSLDALIKEGYTHLLIQYGAAEQTYTNSATAAYAYLQQGGNAERLLISGLDFAPDSLRKQFKQVQDTNGLCISHAGSGTILAALRYQFPVVAVPNTQLLHNHQEQLADALESSKYLVRGHVENLEPAITKASEFRKKMTQLPPITSGEHRDTKSFGVIMDETLGYLE